MDFRQFIQRGKVINMYRKFMRLTKRIPDKQTRLETRQWIRDDFHRHAGQTDPARIDVILAQANRHYKELESGVFSML
ncbi:LYR motif-containing protein 2 [Coemansia asiatica]|nr:LYR motif-containing protein 2 [Coemansia asiatica]